MEKDIQLFFLSFFYFCLYEHFDLKGLGGKKNEKAWFEGNFCFQVFETIGNFELRSFAED